MELLSQRRRGDENANGKKQRGSQTRRCGGESCLNECPLFLFLPSGRGEGSCKGEKLCSIMKNKDNEI